MRKLNPRETWERAMASATPASDKVEAIIYDSSRIASMRKIVRIEAGLLAKADGKKRIRVRHARAAVEKVKAMIISGEITRADVGLPDLPKKGEVR